MKEVCYLSAYLSFTFHRIIHESNFFVDAIVMLVHLAHLAYDA